MINEPLQENPAEEPKSKSAQFTSLRSSTPTSPIPTAFSPVIRKRSAIVVLTAIGMGMSTFAAHAAQLGCEPGSKDGSRSNCASSPGIHDDFFSAIGRIFAPPLIAETPAKKTVARGGFGAHGAAHSGAGA